MLAGLVPEGDVRTIGRVKAVADEWKADGFIAALVTNAVRNIAFEVYLEQEVPDCH
jgi:polar amino acid transport system substrate-binding protein